MNPDPNLGLFGPDSLLWELTRENLNVLMGPRALLLQVSHPLVGAGVQEHSNYEEDPWGRLERTLAITGEIVFGDLESSQKASLRLKKRHAKVKGKVGNTPYRALDPKLLMWVHATLIDSLITVRELYFKPLSSGQKEQLIEESVSLGEAYGIESQYQPQTYRAFCSYYEKALGELEATETGRRVLKETLSPTPYPKLPLFTHPLWRATIKGSGPLIRAQTIGTMPEIIKGLYGLKVTTLEGTLFKAGTRQIRTLVPIMPKSLRYQASYLEALKRISAPSA